MKKHPYGIKQRAHNLLLHIQRVSVIMMRTLRRVFSAAKRPIVRAYHKTGAWYGKQAERYPILQRLWVRIMLVLVAVAIVFSPIYGILANYAKDRAYQLTSSETALIGQSTVNTKYIKETADAITYNRADEQPATKGAEQAITLAANKADATGKQPYQAVLSKDPKKGITFSDSEGARSITMRPQFSALGARLSENRVIYPGGSEKQIYSFKANGIKSDIVLTAAPDEDIKTFEWQLKLDKTLEARMNADGSVGIYSADANLFDNIQVGDDKTQKLIDKARTNSAKNNLVFELPKPFILDANNQTNYEDVAYSLEGDMLTLTARNLRSQAYPLTIDPTITVTTTADFRQNTGDMGNSDPGTADEIRRSLADNGALGAATRQDTIFATARSQHSSVVYNDYLYIIGGHDGTNYVSDVRYCSFGSNGAINVCNSTTALGVARRSHSSVVYNGYLYVLGGYHAASDTACNGTASNYCSDVQYALICTGSNSGVGGCGATAGTIGTWSATTSMSIARDGHTSVAYNGFIYVMGGYHAASDTACNGSASNYCSDVRYAPIEADGAVGAWSATTSFTTARSRHTSVVYNGNLYVIGGWNGSTYYNDVQYCPIATAGTISACTQQSSAFTTARYGHTSVAYKGYIYIAGGTSGSYQNDTQYCPINNNGSIGACSQQATMFTTARAGHTSVAYGDYFYVIGGTNGTNDDDIQRLQVGPMLPRSVQQTAAFTNARYEHGVVAYDGYIYIVGGWNDSTYYNTITKCPISTNGSAGSCSSAGTMYRNLKGAAVSIYHQTIYISGGWEGGGNSKSDVSYCTIGSDHDVTCTAQTTTLQGGSGDRWLAASAAYNGFLYVAGGQNDSGTPYSNILNCEISDSDFSILGTPDNCPQTSTFTTARSMLSLEAYKGYLYVIGGKNSAGTYLNDIQSCPINSDGSVGTCVSKTTFTNARGEHSSTVHGDKLFITGGWNGSTYYDDIITCDLAGSGGVSGCTSNATAFTTARYGHAAAFLNGYMYIVGGKSSSSKLDDIQYMQITASHGGVSTAGSGSFTTSRDSHVSVAYDGYLYIIGGWNGSSVYGDIQYCSIAGGTIGSCASTTSLNTARYSHAAVVHGTYIYVVNGINSSSTNINSVERCSINTSTHAITSCATPQTNLLTYEANNQAVVTYGNYLYVIGGITSGVYHRDIERCSYATDGSLENCQQQTNIFPNGRNNLSAEVYNGNIYILGGFDGVDYLNDIIHCPINTDGSVGTCIQQIDAMPMNRRSMTTAVYNGYLYIFGGYKNDTVDYYDDTQACQLLANGYVGSCTVTMGALTSPARSSQAAAMYNGYAYVSGGTTSGAGYQNGIQSIYLGSNIPMTARYERFVDTGDGGNTLNSFIINGTSPCNYTVTYKTAGSDGVLGTATTVSGVVPGVSQTLNLTNKQYIFLVATMDDIACGFQTTITSIVVDYVFPLPPSPPTLRAPTTGATGTNVQPDLELGVTGDTSGNLKYYIDVCSTSDCSSIVRTIDQTASGTGWSNIGVVVDTYVVNHKYQLAALSPNTQYWWRAKAIDPTQANLWSNYSSIFTFTTAAVTAAPTLYLPANAATGVNVRPEFRVGVAGNNTGNLKYKIDVCSASDCSAIVRSIDETSSEIGWTALGDVGGTYQMSHTYLEPALTGSTQYWWRAAAKDPNGANTWSAWSSIYSFTTGVVNLPGQIIVNSGSTIYSGSNLKTGN